MGSQTEKAMKSLFRQLLLLILIGKSLGDECGDPELAVECIHYCGDLHDDCLNSCIDETDQCELECSNQLNECLTFCTECFFLMSFNFKKMIFFLKMSQTFNLEH